ARGRLQAGGDRGQAGRLAQAAGGRRQGDRRAGRRAAGPRRRTGHPEGGGGVSLKGPMTARLGGRVRASVGGGHTPEPDAAPPVPPGTTGQAPAKHEGLKAYRAAAMIPIDRLTADPDQPRKTFPDEEIDRMADSLRARGMLQPIRARWDADLARWVIVAGGRPVRAAPRARRAEGPPPTPAAPAAPPPSPGAPAPRN